MSLSGLSALPEGLLAFMGCTILLLGVFFPKMKNLPYHLTRMTLVVAGLLTVFLFVFVFNKQDTLVFYNTFILDRLAVVLNIFILFSVFLAITYSRYYHRERQIPDLEFHVLALFSTLGMLILVSSHNMLTLFLGLELLSLPTYAMVALRRDQSFCVEAAMKYFIIGAVASALLLYGLSLLFGATQSLDFSAIAALVNMVPSQQNLILITSLIFIVVGIAFKLGAAPFHMWVPDVYEGAPTSITLFIASAPKIAAFGMAIRLLVEAMPGLHIEWQHLLIVVSLLSMTVGNIAAIVQTNIKRMLAYSSIAHIGYMLLGILCATPNGYAAALFYVVTYSLMTLVAFGILTLLSHSGFEAEKMEDLAGLNNRNPWLAFVMLVVMFSMAGIPPLVGFIAKLSVLEALIRVHLVWLAVVAILLAVIGSYYYLRVVKVMYFEQGHLSSPIICKPDVNRAITVNGVLLLLMGILPGWLFSLAHWVFGG